MNGVGLEAIPAEWRSKFLVARDVPTRALCGVQRFIFTCGLLTNLRFDGLTYDYDARYCFESRAEAVRALLAWDGSGDPPGEWIKEKLTGRRRVTCTCGRAGRPAIEHAPSCPEGCDPG